MIWRYDGVAGRDLTMMLKPWFLTVHRWLALIFAAPLAVLVLTGLILSLEPILQRTLLTPGALTPERVGALLGEHDAARKATGLVHRSYENTLTITGAGPDGEIEIDLDTGAPTVDDGGWSWAEVFQANRRLHEHLTVAGVDLTIASTVAMLAIIAMGLVMGWPRFRNSLSGWHKGVAWVFLPLLILSPLTGLFLPLGIAMNPSAGPPPPRVAPLPLVDAVAVIARTHDLSDLIWIRQRGGRQLTRLWDGQEARVYAVGAGGLQPMARNVSRGIHEGNILGLWSGIAMLATSLAFVLLSVTGLWIYVRRQVRRMRSGRGSRERALNVPAE